MSEKMENACHIFQTAGLCFQITFYFSFSFFFLQRKSAEDELDQADVWHFLINEKKNVFLIMLLFCQSTNYLDLNIMGLLTRLAFQNPRLSKIDSKGGSNLAQRPVHHSIDGQRSDTIGMQRRSGYSSLIQSSRPILPWFLFWFCQSFPSQTLS